MTAATTHRPNSSDPVVVIGGGVHGTYVARELLESGLPRGQLVILDSNGRLLESFRRKARGCGMETLRSNYVQHVGPSPFGLELFARARNREDELVATHNSQCRPTLSLFLDYADSVIQQFELDTLLTEATVTGIERADGLRIKTIDESIRARRAIIAVGHAGRYCRPEWSRSTDRLEHVWDSAEPPAERINPGENVVVVGGGITACQTALALADCANTVALWSGHPLRKALREADPRWLNWKHIERELHTHPPGSKARVERIAQARNDGKVPPYLLRELRASAVTITTDRIQDLHEFDTGLSLVGEQTRQHDVDRVLLATGFESVATHPFVDRVAQSLSLSRGYDGWPVLDDETLSWQTVDGSSSDLYVTGKLAELTVGPLAGNIPGARRASERLVAAARQQQLLAASP